MKTDDLADLSDSNRSWLMQELEARRVQLGLDKTDLVERTGLSRATVQRATAEDADPQLSTFVRLALALNLQPALTKPGSGAEAPMPEDIVHRGLAYNRTKAPHDGMDRKREAALAAAWERENVHQEVGLSALMRHLIPNHSQEQATAVATVVQWLGSEVGFQFLRRTLDSVGYDIVQRR